MSEIVSDSTPERDEVLDRRRGPGRGRRGRPCCPRESMRSTASRVSASEAGGSGLSMMIQPASGPGVWERARCRIWPKPCGGDEADARALGLEHGVRRDGRAVDEVAQVAGRDAGLRADALDAGQHAVGRVAGRRRRLHAPLPGAVVVDEEQVGERPSHVHSQAIGHGCSARSRRLSLVSVRGSRPPSDDARLAQRVRSSSSTPSSASTASVSAPTVQRAACRTLPGVPLSFGTTPGALTVPVDLVLVARRAGRARGSTGRRRCRRPCRRARTRRRPSLTISVELLGRVPAGQLADDLVEQVLVLAAGVVRGEALVLAQLRLAHELRQPPPQRVVVGGDHDPLAVARLGRRSTGAMRGRRGAGRLADDARLLVLERRSTPSSRSTRR